MAKISKKIDIADLEADQAIELYQEYWASLSARDRELAEKIVMLAKYAGGRSKAAEAMGVSVTTIDNYRQGKTQPRFFEMLHLIKAANHPMAYALCNTGFEGLEWREKTTDDTDILPLLPEGFSWIKKIDVPASAGSGLLVASNDVDGFFALDRYWLSRYVSPSSQIVVMEASGDSMTPSIHNRDIMLVELKEGATVDEIMRGGIFVLSLDGGIVVKRLDIEGNSLVVRSDNPLYPAVYVPSEHIHDRVMVHGQVFWSGGPLATHR